MEIILEKYLLKTSQQNNEQGQNKSLDAVTLKEMNISVAEIVIKVDTK